jgi:oxysterol-binding protein 1
VVYVCLTQVIYVYPLHAHFSPQVQGFVEDSGGNKASFLIGKWDESMYHSNFDTSSVKSADQLQDASLLWEKNKPAPDPARYNLSSFAITLNELTPGLQVWMQT